MANPAPQPSTLPMFGTCLPWVISTFYGLGQRVAANGNIYQATQAGTSNGAGAGPAGNGGAIADNTVVWAFQVAISTAWAQNTVYALGAVVTNGGNFYLCIVAGTSNGAGPGPAGTGNVIADNTVTWSFTGVATAQQTVPTSRAGDIGAVPGSPIFAQYVNLIFFRVYQWLLYVRDFAMQAWTWTGLQTFTRMITLQAFAPETAIVEGPAAPALRQLIYEEQLDGGLGIFVRYYQTTLGVEEVYNAVWVLASLKWHQNVPVVPSIRWRTGYDGKKIGDFAAPGSADWFDTLAGWAVGGGALARVTLDPVGGQVIIASLMAVAAGNVSLPLGSVIANLGDPASDQARIKFKQLLSSSFLKPTVVVGAGMLIGSTATVTDGSTDAKGYVIFNTTAGVQPGGILGTITLDKDYPVVPGIVINPTSDVSQALAWEVFNVSIGVAGHTTFGIKTNGNANLTPNTQFTFCYIVMG